MYSRHDNLIDRKLLVGVTKKMCQHFMLSVSPTHFCVAKHLFYTEVLYSILYWHFIQKPMVKKVLLGPAYENNWYKDPGPDDLGHMTLDQMTLVI